jgi:hypothetical protein
MVYAPRDMEELGAVLDIVRASAWWVGAALLEPFDLESLRDS